MPQLPAPLEPEEFGLYPTCKGCNGKGRYRVAIPQDRKGKPLSRLISCPSCNGRGFTFLPQEELTLMVIHLRRRLAQKGDSWKMPEMKPIRRRA